MGVPQGANLGAARGAITIDTSQPERVPGVMAGVAAGIERSMARVDATMQRAEKGVDDFSGKFQELLGAFGVSLSIAGVAQLGRLTVELANNAAEAERTRAQYEVLAAGVGENAESMLASMRDASRGMISDNELILSANRALLLGVAKNTEEMNQMLEASRVLGQAMGQDVGKSFNDLVVGLGRLSPLILDNLGIANEGEQMFEDYARSVGRTADSLTKAEKRQLLWNKVAEAAAPLLAEEAERAANQADKTNQLATAWENYTDTLGEGINVASGAPAWIEMTTTALETQTSILQTGVEWWNKITGAIAGAAREFEAWQVANGLQTFGPGQGAPASGIGAPPWMAGVNRARTTQRAVGNAPEREALQLDWSESVLELNRQLHEDITNAERDYGRQRADTIADYNKTIAREAEDFAISRRRQEQELAESILDIHEDAAKRDLRLAQDLARDIGRLQGDSAEQMAEFAADRDERIVEARKDSQERLAELEEDYNQAREDAAEDHRLKLLEAAGRLDARAIYLEQQRFQAQEQDAKEAYDEQREEVKTRLDEQLADIRKAYEDRVEDEKKALDKSIAQAQDAHNRQLADARDADAERIQDMQDDFGKRTEQEDADRALRLGRMAEDFGDQLDELDRQHGERIGQIIRHAQDERTELDNQAKEDLIALGVRNDAWLAEQDRKEGEMEKLWDKFWGNIKKSFDPAVNLPPGAPLGEDALPPGFAGASSVPLVGASSTYGMGGGSWSIGDIHVSVAGSNASALDIATAVRVELSRVLRELST